jgi:predicted ATPase
MKLSQIQVQGYRSLVDVSLPLHPLTVMIGPNGSGKTALLEVFLLLSRAARGELAKAIEALGGLNAILSKTAISPDRLQIGLTIDMESEDSREPLYYRFELAPLEPGYTIPFERLERRLDPAASEPHRYIDAQEYNVCFDLNPDTKPSPTGKKHQLLELELATIPPTPLIPAAGPLRRLLMDIVFYSSLDVSQRAIVRLPQLLTPATRPESNGDSLYSALYNLRALHHDTYVRVEDALRVGFPGFEHLEFPVIGAGQVTLAWYQKELTIPLYPNQLSEGTLRFLWLTAVLLAPDPPPLILIDEPEVSLHPELLKLLAGLLQDASVRGQVIVATHSPDLVRWLQPQEVLVLDKVEGRTQFTWADTLDLDEWLEEYTLRDLWLMGTLGGRP